MAEIHLYVLKLADDCWFLGETVDIPRAVRHHFSSQAPPWTALHRPIRMESCFRALEPPARQAKVNEFLERYGADKVRYDIAMEEMLEVKESDTLLEVKETRAPIKRVKDASVNTETTEDSDYKVKPLRTGECISRYLRSFFVALWARIVP